MINSMTAFARTLKQEEWGTVTLELKSVNHRYLEIAIRLPENCRHLEMSLRELIRAELQRGKVDCILTLQLNSSLAEEIELNAVLLSQLAQVINQAQTIIKQGTQLDLVRLIAWPGVLSSKASNIEKIQQSLLQAVKQALTELLAMRQREGQALYNFISQRLDEMSEGIKQIESRQAAMLEHQRHKLLTKFAELKESLDTSRLEQELIFFAQRIDIAEELERLKAHIQEVNKTLEQDQAVGRRLDFLMQELHREANTIGSKSIDADISHWVVELKVLIEQMREQVQNVE